VSGANSRENATIDSVGYIVLQKNYQTAYAEVDTLKSKLRKLGYLSLLAEKKHQNDSVVYYQIQLGNQVKQIKISTGTFFNKTVLPKNEFDTLEVPFQEVTTLLTTIIKELEKIGYPLASVYLNNFDQKGATLFATLEGNSGTKRTIQDIVVNGYDKFPEGHRKQLIRTFKNKPFTQLTLKKIQSEIGRYRFVQSLRYPEVLLTTDSTKVFLYLEKAKANRFDGLIGFSNDQESQSRVQFNGYLDLMLNNTINAGESFSLFWKSDGNDQKTFNVLVELPYLFKSRFSAKGNLQIFRQDSTFQNTKTYAALGYLFDYGMRSYLGYETNESSDIQNTTSATLSDFKSRFYTLSFDLIRYRQDDFLFPEKTKLDLRTGAGSRNSKLQSSKQFFIDVSAMHNVYLNEKNLINLRTRCYYLGSREFLISELFRFGGITSIRGFTENSLQANVATMLLSEYRYLLTSGLYVHSLLDYGWMRDETSILNKNSSLLGLGFGFGLLSKNGLFNLVYANGTANDQAIKLRNSIVHISFKARF
jgi:hemolysin activation/secretion protein